MTDLLEHKALCDHAGARRWPNGTLYCNACRRDLQRAEDGTLQAKPAVADGDIFVDPATYYGSGRTPHTGKANRRRLHLEDPEAFNPNFNGPGGHRPHRVGKSREIDTVEFIRYHKLDQTG